MALIRQLFRQTFECWWLWSSEHCLSSMIVLFAVREQKIIVENEIQELRTKLNDHLDTLQENLMKELTEAQNQRTDETREMQ
jgi:hypothetical protein